MSEDLVRGLIGAGVGLAFGIVLTLLWNAMLAIRDKETECLEKRVDFCEKRITTLHHKYIEFLEGVKQTFQEAQELFEKEKADKEKQDRINQELIKKDTEEDA